MRAWLKLGALVYVVLAVSFLTGCDLCDYYSNGTNFVGTGTTNGSSDSETFPCAVYAAGPSSVEPEGFTLATQVEIAANGAGLLGPVRADNVEVRGSVIEDGYEETGYQRSFDVHTSGFCQAPFLGSASLPNAVTPAEWEMVWVSSAGSVVAKMWGVQMICDNIAPPIVNEWVNAGDEVDITCEAQVGSFGQFIAGIPSAIQQGPWQEAIDAPTQLAVTPPNGFDPSGYLDVYDNYGNYLSSLNWDWTDSTTGVLAATTMQNAFPFGESTVIVNDRYGNPEAAFKVDMRTNGSIYRMYGYLRPGVPSSGGEHVYMVTPTNPDYVQAYWGYNVEEVAFHLAEGTPPGPSWVPFYALYSYNSGENFYTAWKSEASTLINSGSWKYIPWGGILWSPQGAGYIGYIDTQQDPGTVPLYRVYDSPGNGTHFWSTSWDEIYNNCILYGWTYEGIAGYVYP